MARASKQEKWRETVNGAEAVQEQKIEESAFIGDIDINMSFEMLRQMEAMHKAYLQQQALKSAPKAQ
ncbi:MAG: hypothetical protein JSS50_01520 [Proteobacteria bacterium]|nr:hypothetical protein [Pseudomonadota bacterium]